MSFELTSLYKPTGDQPKAIEKLVAGIEAGTRHQTLLGVTGSGKTFTMANVIAKIKKPTLIISHNKTLAAQLASEFEEFFPNAAVHYFVSYYDYYQPEAYIPTSDTYIEKETNINEEIDRLRHAATQALLSRQDVIIVASVSCIYGLGSPEEYQAVSLKLRVKDAVRGRAEILRSLIDMRYERNDIDLHRGTFRVRGNIIDVFPVFSLEDVWRLEFSGNQLIKLSEIDSLTGSVLHIMEEITIYPATHYVAPQERLNEILKEIEQDLEQEVKRFLALGKHLEAERLAQRVKFDLEMIRATGYCNGIENYSRYFDQRKPGQPPYTLIDFFRYATCRDADRGDRPNRGNGVQKDSFDWSSAAGANPQFLTFIDESHMTLPQIRGMFAGDKSRKDTLIDYGFRLPAARDNRPLKFEEFNERIGRIIYVSATPSEYEIMHSKNAVAEQFIRPTGLLDPTIEIHPLSHQIDHLIGEVRARVEKKQRVLITTLTKRMAEDLAEYLEEIKINAAYIHADVETFERLELLRDLRLGVYDVLVGINLLREGLDLPEVSLVAILDADKEGFLRSDTSFIQIMGRAARHREGHVILYADRTTGSMKRAIEETKRRRATQETYNKTHGIIPQSIVKKVREGVLAHRAVSAPIGKERSLQSLNEIPPEEIPRLLHDLERQMDLAAKNLEFEKAAGLRDQIKILKERAPTTPIPTRGRSGSFTRIHAAKS